ncbi:BTB/POZ domain-containing protein KCTD3-like isoform X2 [Halichondria panicea]
MQLTTGSKTDFSRQVLQIVGHGNSLAVAYNHCVCVLTVKECRGWEVVFTTPTLERVPQRIALNTRISGGQGGPILAAVVGNEIRVWSCSSTSSQVLATLDMKLLVDGLFFIGMQLVAVSNTGKVAVWQSVQRHWQLQDVEPICSYDAAGSFLLLGCTNGCIYYIDMEKFPVRMKDNDLLVTELFDDPCKEPITALSVYVTSNAFPGDTENWMEVAYGTRGGAVRVVVRHPENIGQAPQVFQTYNVHTCPIMKVVLGEKHLISVCAENHVRSWTMTRFRGRISTQPGSSPIASFKILSLEGPHSLYYPVISIGPFGERDEEMVFVQRVIPEIDRVFVRSSSTGQRVCHIDSVDGSNISAYTVHECEAINRVGMRSKRFIFTGHLNGSIQVWDLTTALDRVHKQPDSCTEEGGPTKAELLDLLQHCEVGGASRMSSAVSSRAPSPSPSLMSIIYPGFKPPTGRDSLPCTPQLGQRTLHTSHSSNLFQPIHTSNSSNSIGATEASTPQSTLVTVTAKKSPTPTPDVIEQPDLNETEEQIEGEATDVVSPPSNHSSPVHTTPPPQESSSHQRSRSNEIDYGLSSRSRGISAFRSPSDSTTFRPLSVDSVALPPTGSIPPTAAGEQRVRLGSAGSTWLKDESISTFFGPSGTIEQFLHSDEPLLNVLNVTDC